MIKQAGRMDCSTAAELAKLLWPKHTHEDLNEEMMKFIASEDGALFLFYAEDMPIGFAQCCLRRDYVEGTRSSPVGYLEGIFIKTEYRNRGIAKELLAQCELWAAEKGCCEFASDCELDNEGSLGFHLSLGFKVANRIICFKKNLE